MTIQSGIVTAVSVDASDGTTFTNISAYTTSVQVGVPTNLQDITTLDKVAIARLSLLKDFTVQLSGQYAPEVTAVFKNDTGLIRTVTIALSNATDTVTGECKLGDWQPYNRDQSGNAVWSATLSNADGNAAGWS